MYQKYILACVGIIKLKSKLCVWMSVDAIMGLHYEQKCCLAVYHLFIQTRVENRIEMGQAKNWNIKTKWATSMTRSTGSHLQGDLCSDQGNQKLLPKGEWKVGRERKSPLNIGNFSQPAKYHYFLLSALVRLTSSPVLPTFIRNFCPSNTWIIS